MSVAVEGITQAQAAGRYGLSEGHVSKLMARWRSEGPAAFEARSRWPRATSTKVPGAVVELVVNLRSELDAQGLDAGAHTICWHLDKRHQITVSISTVWRLLKDAGLIDAARGMRACRSRSGSRLRRKRASWSAISLP